MREGSKGSGEKSIPGRVGAGMALIAIDEYPLLPFDSLNWSDLGLVGFVYGNRRVVAVCFCSSLLRVFPQKKKSA